MVFSCCQTICLQQRLNWKPFSAEMEKWIVDNPSSFFLKLSCSSFTIHLSYFIAQQQACIQIAATIYTQACPRTSLFCFLLYQLSPWWVKYRAQPEAINPWKHASRNAPWQAETSWGEKVKPRKPAWNQAFLWLPICGCQVRNKNFCKKTSPTRLSIGSYTNLSLVGLIFLFIIRGLNLTTDDIIPAHTNRLNWNTPLPRTAFLWTKTLYKSLKFLFCIHKVVRRILTIRCWPADCYKLYSLISNLSVQFSF